MTDFETPIMRDIFKLMPNIILGILIIICGLLIFVIPFHLTVYGDHCTMTKSYSFAQWILDSVLMKC